MNRGIAPSGALFTLGFLLMFCAAMVIIADLWFGWPMMAAAGLLMLTNEKLGYDEWEDLGVSPPSKGCENTSTRVATDALLK